MEDQSTLEKNEYISLAQAAEGTPYSQEYLSLLVRKGKLHAKKIGRNWHTTKAHVAEYLDRQKEAALKKIQLTTNEDAVSASLTSQSHFREDMVSHTISDAPLLPQKIKDLKHAVFFRIEIDEVA